MLKLSFLVVEATLTICTGHSIVCESVQYLGFLLPKFQTQLPYISDVFGNTTDFHNTASSRTK